MKHGTKRNTFKKIGRGIEHNVFSTVDGRVLKRPTTERQKLLLLRKWYPKETDKRYKKFIRDTEGETGYSQRGLQRHVLKRAAWLVGNPVFLENLRYTQDKVTTLGKYLRLHTYKENKAVIQSYVRCIFYQWEYGFYQKVANFTINYGVDKKGRVILIDLGELTFSKAEVAKHINEKKWLASWSYKTFKDKKLKGYYAGFLDSKLTLTALDRLWKRKQTP